MSSSLAVTGSGIHQVERLPDRVVRPRACDQRVDDEVDRHDVERRRRAPELRDRRAARLAERDHAQHVVGAVELLGLARARVAHHDRRPIDRRRDLVHRLADPDLGLELGRLVVVLERLAERELVLVDHALADAGHVGRAHVVEPLEPVGRRAELEHVPGPVDVDALRELERNGEVVDRGQVEGARDLAGQAVPGLVVEAEPPLGDVALDHLDAVAVELCRRRRARPRPCAARPARRRAGRRPPRAGARRAGGR